MAKTCGGAFVWRVEDLDGPRVLPGTAVVQNYICRSKPFFCSMTKCRQPWPLWEDTGAKQTKGKTREQSEEAAPSEDVQMEQSAPAERGP